MSQQVNISLAFTADTAQAKANIQSLITELNKLSSNTKFDTPITQEIMEAQVAARQLGDILKQSFNTNANKLDLSKFTKELNSSGMSLQQYGAKLSSLGVEGDKAFLQIANSIAKTQGPLRQSSGLLNGLTTTLKNTAKWQISSSILHGFMGAVQQAYGYAKDLDKSLNNIRIVTGYSAEEMSMFAAEANKAAKALSATTTQYTNASLIYYQQGLDDQQVKERTNTTIKMANVSRQSAEVVADQMTAIWNNFDDGAHSLEYYADVLTALGAATASSTDEIAGGLEKFAALGETIGLSYEYAASALATITSNTRQSEEVVGTALKTIFARIQGLKLGETLDDGTTLNDYSEALQKVGVSIFEQNGEMKKMDNILDDLASKWTTLSKDQQVALAQSVAGVRQYTQLIALMDNWNAKGPNDADSMTQNLATARGSSGTLEEQNKIYEESWEASSKRVKASAEEIYNSLIDPEFFVQLNDMFSTVLRGVSSVINAMGGIKGVLGAVGLIITKIYGQDLANGINNALTNFKMFTGVAQQEMGKVKKEAYDAAMSLTEGFKDSSGVQSLRESLQNTYTLQNDLTAAVKRMSPEQRAVAEESVKIAQHYNDIAVAAGKAADEASELYQNTMKTSQESRATAKTTMQQNYDNAVGQSGSDFLASARGMAQSASSLGVDTKPLEAQIKSYSQLIHSMSEEELRSEEGKRRLSEAGNRLMETMGRLATSAETSDAAFESYELALTESANKAVSAQSKFAKLQESLALGNNKKSGDSLVIEIEGIIAEAKKANIDMSKFEAAINRYKQAAKNARGDTAKLAEAEEQLRRAMTTTHISTDDVTDAIIRQSNANGEGGKKVSVVTEEMRKQAEAARNSAAATQGAGEAIRVAGEKTAEAQAKIKANTLAYQSIGSAATGALRGLSSFAMGINSIKSMFETINNDDLSIFEKALQVMMSLGMVVPMLTAGVGSLANVWRFMVSNQEKGLAIQLASLFGMEKETLVTGYLITEKTAEGKARTYVGNATMAEAAKKKGATVVTQYDTAATWANIAAKMVQFWYIGVIIAVMGVLIALFYDLAQAQNAEAEAAQNATERAKALRSAYDEAQESAKQLQDTVDNYKTLRDSFNSLIEGTNEFKQALIEANGEALKLLEEYEFLAHYTKRGENGLLTISDEGLDRIIAEQLNKVEEKQLEYMIAQYDSSQANETYERSQFAKTINMDKNVANKLLDEMVDWFNDKEVTAASAIDLTSFDAYNNATDEQRKAIEQNIAEYNKMALSLQNYRVAQDSLANSLSDTMFEMGWGESVGDNPDTSPILAEASGLTETKEIAYSIFEQQAKIASEQAESDYKRKLADPTPQQFADTYFELVKDEGTTLLDKIDPSQVILDRYLEFIGKTSDDVEIKKDTYWGKRVSGEANEWLDQVRPYVREREKSEYNGRFDSQQVPSTWLSHTVFDEYTIDGMKMSVSEMIDEITRGYVINEHVASARERAEDFRDIKNEQVFNELDDENDINWRALSRLINTTGADETGQNGATGLEEFWVPQETAQNLLDNWDDYAKALSATEGFATLSKKAGFNSEAFYLQTLKKWLQERSKKLDSEAFKNSNYNGEKISNIATNVQTIYESDDFSAVDFAQDQSYLNMKSYAYDLATIYPELKDAASTFGSVVNIGNAAWEEAYAILAEKMHELNFEEQALPYLSHLEKYGKISRKDTDGDGVPNEESQETQYDSWLEFYNSLNDDEKKLFLQIDFNQNNTTYLIKKEIQRLQSIADENELEIKLNTVTDAQKLLKRNMSKEDWAQIQAALDWGQDGYIQFSDFVNMSYEEQQQYFNSLYYKTQQDMVAENNEQIAILNAKLNEAKRKVANKGARGGTGVDVNQSPEVQDLMQQIADLEAQNNIINQLSMAGLVAEQSLGALYAAMSKKLEEGYLVDSNYYINTLTLLGEQYDNCTNEIEAFKQALQSGDTVLAKAAGDTLEAAIIAGEFAEQYGFSGEELERYADQLKLHNQYASISKQTLIHLAKDQKRYDRAVDSATDNMDTWNEAVKTFNKGGVIASEVLVDMADTYGDLLDIDGEQLSTKFLTDPTNLENMKKALEGDEQAYKDLQMAVGKDILVSLGLDATQFEQDLMNLELILGQNIDDIEIGAKIDSTAAIQEMENIINNANMTAKQAESYLSSMGIDAEVVTEEVTNSVPGPTGVEPIITPETFEGTNVLDGSSIPYTFPKVEYQSIPSVSTEQTVLGTALKVTSASKSSGGELKHITNTTTGGKKPNKNGASSKPKKTSESRGKKSDIVNRYKEIDDKIDDTQNTIDKASKAMDRLYGPKRLKEMEKINKTLQTEIKQLKEKRKEAEQYLKIDQQDLNKTASALNISFTFDNGNISNYEEAMTSIYNKREALLKSFGSTINEKEQEQLDAFDKKIEELKAAIEQYDETRELTEDLDNEIKDAMNEWQDNNYEQLTYKLELQVEINDRDLEVLEYYLSKTEDDFYKQAEGIGYLTQQVGIYNDKLEDNQKHLADLQQEYKDENISQANYIEGLKEIFGATVDDAQALADLDKQMLEYYGNTLDMASEEISKYTERMEHQTSVLEHFKNIMDIIGESTNYEALGVILEGQAQTIENELKVAQETYDFYSSEAAKKKDLMDRAIASGNMEAAELYRKEWEAAEAAAREAQDNMLSRTEEWAEAMKTILENKLAGLAQTLENALTGGTSFDAITTQMERAASLQEEYLTSTNKIYETNKLINTAQKEIDKTTNTVAKKRLKSFQEETAQLQNKSKLSQYELDIQQAKYELLLAEIALEEAQQAKSIVRLQRDSEGNFGYVYTADANAVADAEQKLADAQNNLYNIGLDGANDYSQKYIQIMQEMHETFSELQQQYLNGEFETEEDYHRAMEDAKAYYFQKLQDYSNLYQVALTTDSRVIADAWSTDFGIMTTKTEDWKKAVNGYLDEVNKAFEGWEEVVERVKTETVGQDLDALEDKTQAIVDVSADLSEQITKEGGVIDSIEAEMAAVSAITSTYAQWREEIAATIAENEKLMHQTNAIIAEEAGGKSSVSSKDGNLKTDNKDKSNATTSSTEASGNNGAGSKQPSIVDGSKVTVKKTARHFSRDGGNGTKMQDWVPGYTFTVIDIDGNEVLIGKGNSYSQATGWVRKTDLEGFKTGGYTGSWGSEGKLAMLHQKELILNADDTANFLASLEILREIINVIDLHSAHAQLSGLLSSPAYRDYNEPQTLEQQVHIEASFPNVQDRHEIEEAFTNLVNRASQFVNRK